MRSRTILAVSHAWNVGRVLMAPKNRAKKSWRGTDPHALYLLAGGEFRELQEALRLHSMGKVPARRVVEEAADAAAYLGMVSDVVARREREQQNDTSITFR